MSKLSKNLAGIRNMDKLPDVIFVVDPVEEELSIAEAKRLNISVVAVCDTDCDPDLIDYPIPGNDDAARSIKFFCSLMADAILEGRAERSAQQSASVEGAEKEMLESETNSEEGVSMEAEGMVSEEATQTVPEA